MKSQYLSVENFVLDLRSGKSTWIKKGFSLRLLGITTLIFLDITSLLIAWHYALAYGTPLSSDWTNHYSYFLLLALSISIGIIAITKNYKAGVQNHKLLELIKAILLSDLIVLLIAFIYEPKISLTRSIFLLYALFSTIFISTGRLIFQEIIKLLRKNGAIRHSVYLITDKEDKQNSIHLIEKENSYKLVGVANAKSLDKDNRHETLANLNKLGVSEVFVSWNAIKNRLYIAWHFQSAGITLRILPSNNEYLPANATIWMVGKVPSITIPASIITGSDFWFKRCLDFCISIIVLLLISPLLLIIALLIKLDSPGPVFFKQSRVGLHQKTFKMWKFRTMVTNAEKLQAALEVKNEIKDGILFKIKDDPRITRLGKFLRQYSLDELPQLFNVVIGEMSLVGPRPLPLRDVEKFKSNYFIRQEVLPGITGLWQVSGRSNIENFDEGVKLDIAYIENWTLQLDFQILFQTVFVVLFKKGAY
jgi:exopolysaccharide biosynthesis polyprenyl glycosylphosphotransferase